MILPLQAFKQRQFGLEIDIVGKFKVRNETGRLDVIGMRQHKLFILSGARHFFAVLRRLERTVHQRHRHRFTLAHAERQAVAAGKVRRFILRGDKAVNHFAFGHQQFTDIDGESQLFGSDLHRDVAAANFTGKRVVAPVAALGGVGQRQQIALVAARQLLQARRARAGIDRRMAGDIVGLRVGISFGFRQFLLNQQIKNVRRGFLRRAIGRQRRRFAVGCNRRLGRAAGRREYLYRPPKYGAQGAFRRCRRAR